MRFRYIVTGLLALQLFGGIGAAQAQGRRNRNVVTEEELASSSATDAFAALKALRPAWFVIRGSVGTIVVYVDGRKLSDVEELQAIQIERIKEARYLNAADATTRYGTGHNAGAIEITTKR